MRRSSPTLNQALLVSVVSAACLRLRQPAAVADSTQDLLYLWFDARRAHPSSPLTQVLPAPCCSSYPQGLASRLAVKRVSPKSPCDEFINTHCTPTPRQPSVPGALPSLSLALRNNKSWPSVVTLAFAAVAPDLAPPSLNVTETLASPHTHPAE